jgi:hypothetical protein
MKPGLTPSHRRLVNQLIDKLGITSFRAEDLLLPALPPSAEEGYSLDQVWLNSFM